MGGKYDVKFGDNSLIIRLHRLCYKPRYKVGSIVTKVSPSPPTQTPLWPPPLSLSCPVRVKGLWMLFYSFPAVSVVIYLSIGIFSIGLGAPAVVCHWAINSFGAHLRIVPRISSGPPHPANLIRRIHLDHLGGEGEGGGLSPWLTNSVD